MKYIVEGFATEQLSESIENSPCKRLIQELNFKYGLKVLTKEERHPLMRHQYDTFLLTESTGAFVVAKVWIDKEDGHDVYNYRSPFYRKDRGSDTADRETIHSKKLSTLMATLKRQDVVPSLDVVMSRSHANNFEIGKSQLESHHGNTYKNNKLDVEDIHDLLRAVIRETPNTLDLEKCKKELDKLDQIDRIKEEKEKDIERFFTEFYAIGADSLNHLVIGTVKRVKMVDKDNYMFEVVKPFVRVKDLSNHEHLQPIMLMHKVYHEGKNVEKFYANYIPQSSGYLNDLDVINATYSRVDEYNLTWMLTPCSTI